METLKIEDILDPIKKREMKEKLEKEYKLDPKELKKLKKTAREGKKGAENARYILFVIGENYAEIKSFDEKIDEKVIQKGHMWFERKMPGRQEETWNKAIREEQERHWEQLKMSKENGRPANFKELEKYLKQERYTLSLSILEKKYTNNPEKLEELEELKRDQKNNIDAFPRKYKKEIEEAKKEYLYAESLSLEPYNKRLDRGEDTESIKDLQAKLEELSQNIEKLDSGEISLSEFINIYKKQEQLFKVKKFNKVFNKSLKGSKTFKTFKKIKQYEKDLSEIESIKNTASESKKSEKKEKAMLGGFFKSGLLKKYNPGLYSAARRVNQLDEAKKLSKIPSLERALLEVGRPDLTFGPEKLVAYLERMDREGLPVSKLSAEVWQCSKAIDALSDAQLYELATEGNPAALGYLRHNVAKNPWLLVGNKNIGGKYEPRRGTGVSKFVLKSALGIEIGAFSDFLKGAQEIMPELTDKTEKDEERHTFEGWIKELLSKQTGEDVLAWDDKAFKPGNPTFDLFTKYAHPGQLGLIPPNGTLAEKRKPIITDLLIEHKNAYKNEKTKEYIEELEKIITGKETGNVEEAAKGIEQSKIEKLEQKLKEANEKLENTIYDVLVPLNEFNRLSRDLSHEEKNTPLYIKLESAKKLLEQSIGLKRIELTREGDDYDPDIHRADAPPAPGERKKIKKIVEDGYLLEGEVFRYPKVELE